MRLVPVSAGCYALWLAAALILPLHVSGSAGEHRKPAPAPAKATTEHTVYDFALPGSDGKDIPLARFRGQYILLVNLARESSYSAQLAPLSGISEAYKTRGVVVIGVPSNDFGGSEPGSNADIQKWYADAKVPFLVTAAAKVTGDDALPLYAFLTSAASGPAGESVHWNYTKFIIGPDGKLITRLDPDVTPDSPEMKATLEQILEHRFKPATPPTHANLDVAAK